MSRKLRKNTPTWNQRVRTTDATKSLRTARAPVAAMTWWAAGEMACPGVGLHDAGVTVGSAATSRSCRQARNCVSMRPVC